MLGLGIAAEMSWTMAVASNGAAVGEAESTAGMSATGMGPVYLRRLGIPYAAGSRVGPRPVVRRAGPGERGGVQVRRLARRGACRSRPSGSVPSRVLHTTGLRAHRF